MSGKNVSRLHSRCTESLTYLAYPCQRLSEAFPYSYLPCHPSSPPLAYPSYRLRPPLLCHLSFPSTHPAHCPSYHRDSGSLHTAACRPCLGNHPWERLESHRPLAAGSRHGCNSTCHSYSHGCCTRHLCRHGKNRSPFADPATMSSLQILIPNDSYLNYCFLLVHPLGECEMGL